MGETENQAREKTFELFMRHWQQMDERQRRTWLALLVGKLPLVELEGLERRLVSRKERITHERRR